MNLIDLLGLIARLWIILGCIVLALLLVRAYRKDSKNWNQKTKDHWWYEFSWTLFMGVFGTTEALWQGAPVGGRLLVGLFVVWVGFRAVLGHGKVEVSDDAADLRQRRYWTRG